MLNLNLNIIGGGIQRNKSDYDSTMVINFEQTSSAELNLNVVGTASLGFLGDRTFEKNYISTQSATPLDTFRFDRSSRVKATLSGSGDWGIWQELETSPSSSYSLVTMSLEVPYFGLVSKGFSSSSIIDVEFTGSLARQVYDVNSFVNVENPTLYIDYVLVGGGGGGEQAFSSPGYGGEAGEIKAGTAKIYVNPQTVITSVAGAAGSKGVCGVSEATNGTSSSLTFVDAETGTTVTLFASGGRAGEIGGTSIGAAGQNGNIPAQCGSTPLTWFNGWKIGWGGNGGIQNYSPLPCPVTQSVNQFVPSGITTRPGYGGNGGNSNLDFRCVTGFDGGPGLALFRFYNPDNIITITGNGIRQDIDGYTYLYLPSTSTVTLSFPDQKNPPEPLDDDVQSFISATGIESLTTAYALNNFVKALKLTGLWDKMDVIYPFVGGNAETHKYNLKDARDLDEAYRITFSGSWDHTIQEGIVPITLPGNRFNALGDTHYRRSGIDNNIALSFFTKTNVIQSNAIDKYTFGSAVNATVDPNPENRGNYVLKINQVSDIATAEFGNGEAVYTPNDNPITGFVVGSRTTNELTKVYWNGILRDVDTNLNTLAWPERNVHFGLPAPLLNNSQPNTQYSGLNCTFAHIGDGLNDTEVSILTNLVNTLQKSLDR